MCVLQGIEALFACYHACMCGRFANQQRNQEAWDAYFVDMGCGSFETIADSVSIGYNIAPTQTIPIVTKDSWLAARWGMIGPWAKETKDVSTTFATFNARSETVSEKATFRSAWNKGLRCVIPALGYYEWIRTEDGKQPYFVQSMDSSPVCFGGLYEPARGDIPNSCTIITLPASCEMKPLHHRMPLMFSNPIHWLSEGTFDTHLDSLSWHAVSKAVNNPRNQGEALITAQ